MNKPDDLSSPFTSTAPRVEEVWRRSLRIHPDAERMLGVLDTTSPAVQREIERMRAGEPGRLPVVASVPEETRYIILTEAAALAAGKALGLVAPQVQIVNCTSMAHALALMIEMNQSQPKSLLDVAMEVYYCHRAQKKLAKERQRNGGGDHRSVAAKTSQSEGAVPAGLAGTDCGETRDIVAKITHQSRERVCLMIKLIKKARKTNPNNPRDTKIGRALALPDADLRAIAKEFNVLKAPSQTAKSSRSAPVPTSQTNTTPRAAALSEDAPSGKASGGNTPSGPTGHNPATAKVDNLASAVASLSALEDAVEKFAARSTTTKRTPQGALAWMLAYSLDALTHRLRECVGDDVFGTVRHTNKRGEGKCRCTVRAWLEKADAKAEGAFTHELGQEGACLVQDLRAGSADLDREQLLLVLRAIVSVTSASTKP